MGTISETLQIQDKFSSTFSRFDSLGEKVARTLEHIDGTLTEYTQAQDEAKKKTDQHSESASKANASFSALMGTVGKLAATLGGLAAIKGMISMSDDLSLMTTRLNNVNDGLQSTSELYDMIFASAQRARGSFTDMAQTVSSLKAQTGDTFSSVKEAVAFTELLNKQFKIAGTDATGIASTMYNLTQALSTGTLKGQDLNTVFANAPQLVKRIADYMGQPIGKIKDLASEGKITADIVKNAVLGAADDINAQFESMPLTFGDAMQKVKNVGILAFQPIAEMISSAIASPQFDAATRAMSDGLLMVAEVGSGALERLGNLIQYCTDNFNRFQPVVNVIATVLHQLGEIGEAAFSVLEDCVYYFTDNLQNLQPTLDMVTGAVNLIGIVGATAFDKLGQVVRLCIDNLKTIGPIIGVIAGAIALYNGAMIIANAVTAIHSAVTTAAGIAQAVYSVATAAAAGSQSALNAALAACPITWIIAAIVAAIAVVVGLIIVFHNLANTGHTVFGDIAGTVLGAFAVIQNALAIAANAFIAAAEWIVNAWNTGVYNIQMAIYNFAVGAATQFNSVIDAADGAATAIANAFIAGANKAIQGINWIIEAINKIPGIDIGKMGEIGQVDSVISKRIDVGAIKAPTQAEAVSFGRFSTTSMGDAFSSGFERGAAAGDAAQNKLTGAISGLKGNIQDLMGGGSIGDLLDSNENLANAASGGAGGKGNVGSVDKVKKVDNVKLSDEDLKVYRDLAEKRYMANVELQTLAPEIHVSIPESAAKNLTSEDIAEKLKRMLIDQAAAHTAVAHAH